MATSLLVLAGVFAMCLAVPANAAEDVAAKIIATERAGLERSDHGDVAMFLKLSAPDVVYQDPFLDQPLAGLGNLTAYYATVFKPDEKPSVRGEMQNERVQVLGDTAVLTFNYIARKVASGEVVRRWNAVEVYSKRDGEWRIVNTHWAYTKALPPKE